MPRAPSKAELQERLARAERQNSAYYEWFRSVERDEEEHEVSFLDYDTTVASEPVRIYVRFRALTRSCGGVVVTRSDDSDWTTSPEFLVDLVTRWLNSHSPYIRDAARELLKRQHDSLTKAV